MPGHRRHRQHSATLVGGGQAAAHAGGAHRQVSQLFIYLTWVRRTSLDLFVDLGSAHVRACPALSLGCLNKLLRTLDGTPTGWPAHSTSNTKLFFGMVGGGQAAAHAGRAR